MKKLLLIGFLTLLPTLLTQAEPSVTGLTVNPNGTFTFDGIDFVLQHNDGDWKKTDQATATAEPATTADGAITYHGSWMIDVATAKYEETIRPLDEHRFQLTCKVTLPASVTTNVLALSAKLPASEVQGKAVTCDGKSIALPATTPDDAHLLASKASQLTIPSKTGTITAVGSFACNLQDNRKWRGSDFQVHYDLTKEVSSSNDEVVWTLVLEMSSAAQ